MAPTLPAPNTFCGLPMDPVRLQWLTLTLMVALALGVAILDVVLAHKLGVEATFSRVSFELFRLMPVLYPILIFALGVLVGHLGLPQFVRPR